jgi:hypothetical protein
MWTGSVGCVLSYEVEVLSLVSERKCGSGA